MWLLASAMLALGIAEASSTPRHKHVPPQRSKAAKAEHHKRGSAPETKRSERTVGPRIPLASDQSTAATLQLSPDLAATKQAIALVQQRRFADATTLAASISDRVAQKVVEWALLRNSNGTAGFDRYAVFIQANPEWPSIPLLRKRAEARLWNERRDPATVRRFIGERPDSAPGRLALARVLLREGDHEGAARVVRMVWRSAEMSAELETSMVDAFPDQLTAADHTVRMDRQIGAKDFGAAMRAAKRLGPAQVAIVKACDAAAANSAKSGALLEAVTKEARSDLGYALCRLHWLLARNELAAAAKVVAEHAQRDLQLQDTDEWCASAACWPAGSSIWAMSRRPIGWCAMPLFPPIYIIAPNIISWAAGSRSAFCMIRAPRFSILSMSMKARPTRLYWRVLPIGAAGQRKRPAGSRTCAHSTRQPPAIPPPITVN
ncbi:MAG: hypothetical protein WCB23_04730 [Pseudolabrys sp.]